MEKLSRFVLRHKLLVGLLTLLAFAVGVGATALLIPNVSEQNAYPGLPAYEANQEIMQRYGNGGYERPFVPVITLPEGQTVDSSGVEDALDRAFAAVAEANDARVVSHADSGDENFIGDDGRTTFGLVFGRPVEQGGLPGGALGEIPDPSPAITEAMQPELPPGAALHVTGLDTLATSGDQGGLNVPVKLLVGSVAATVVLLWAFRSMLAFVPLLIAIVAIPLSFVALLGISPFVRIHETTVMMLPLFGLGVAIDYALLLVSRWREEQARGHRGDEAVHRAMRTAGCAILFSGGAVAIGLATMIVLPIPFLRSLGLGGTMIAASSVLVSLTLLPIILATTGRRLDRKGLEAESRRFAETEEVSNNLDTANRAAEPGRAWFALARGVVRFRWRIALGAGGVLLALAITGLGINLSIPESKNLATYGPGHEGLVALEAAGIPSGALTSFDVFVSSGTDSISLVTFVMLARAFRSLLLPIKAILLNLLSLGAVLGAMVILWQFGWGTETIFDIPSNGTLGTFVPVTIFAFLYGLSMDYEVFILARMREEYDRTGSTREAVIESVGHTGRLVTCAALILFLSFATAATGGEMDVSIFASGVALGMLIDVTLIRALLVPAVVVMMGKWNWWLPGWVARMLCVPPSPLRDEPPEPADSRGT
ncbi:MAG: MMPL family transporter [Actinobacteria bacterium]|nr:MMPL family transporter [Actinomycetota bacterium]